MVADRAAEANLSLEAASKIAMGMSIAVIILE